jgi:hypothetical protein
MAASGQDAGMDIRAVAFDVNGTLVRILTEDGMEEIFRAAAHFLTYQGIGLCRDQIRELYFQIMAEQQDASHEKHPEFDALGIWRRIIDEHQTDFTRGLPVAKLEQVPPFLAEMSRGISRRQLGLYHTPARCSMRCASNTLSPSSPTRRALTRGPNCTGSACSATSTRSSFPATSAIASPTGGCFSLRSTG